MWTSLGSWAAWFPKGKHPNRESVCVKHKGPGSEPAPTNQYQEKNPKSDTDVAWDVWESNDGTAITLSNSKAREQCGRRGRKNMKTTGWRRAL